MFSDINKPVRISGPGSSYTHQVISSRSGSISSTPPITIPVLFSLTTFSRLPVASRSTSESGVYYVVSKVITINICAYVLASTFQATDEVMTATSLKIAMILYSYNDLMLAIFVIFNPHHCAGDSEFCNA